MNKPLKITFFSLSIAFLLSTVAATEGRGQDVLREVLKRMDSHNKSLQSLQANVTMVKTNSQLGTSDESVGSTTYLIAKRTRYVRIDWTKPAEEQMALIGDNYEVYRPRLNQVIVGKVQKAQGRQGVGNALAFMNMSRAQLEANYDTAFIGVEQIQGGTQTWHVQLIPKNGSSYKVADLWVDSNGMPRQAKVTEMNNDTTTVLLSNIRENETVQGSIFKLKYPSNAKKIRA